MKWTCKKCGSCCKMVQCKLLKGGNTCPIYKDRPELCRVNVVVKATDEERILACKRLQEFVSKGGR